MPLIKVIVGLIASANSSTNTVKTLLLMSVESSAIAICYPRSDISTGYGSVVKMPKEKRDVLKTLSNTLSIQKLLYDTS